MDGTINIREKINMRNYGIRYPCGGSTKECDSENNYRAWIPTEKIDKFLDIDKNITKDKGHHNHEFIPKDYVPKVKR